MQTITVTGRLGRDAKIYTTSTGNEFIAFSMASNRRIKNNEEKTTWWDVIVPNYLVGRYRKMVDYLKKGSAVIVMGELDPSIRKDNNGAESLSLTISADVIQFNSTGKDSGATENSTQEAKAAPAPYADKPQAAKKVNDIPEDIPMTSAPKADAAPVVTDNGEDDLPF